MVSIYRSCNATVAHLPGVRPVLAGTAEAIEGLAQALFAPHNRPGRHELGVEHDDLDSLVVLKGPAPLSVEFGRSPGLDGKGGMRGLHILGRAAGI